MVINRDVIKARVTLFLSLSLSLPLSLAFARYCEVCVLTAYDKRMCERQSSASTKEATSCIVSGDVVATLKSYDVILTHNSPTLRLLNSINEAHTLKN